MVWRPEDEPEFKLHEALIVVEETRGHEKTLAMLKQEVTRLEVLDRLRAARRPPALPAPAVPAKSRELVAAAGVLEFYAEPNNWTGGRQSPIMRDKGSRARAALADITPEDAEDE